jgi:hypothetical protein
MPLAEAVLLLWSWIASPQALEALFEAHRGRCYHRVLGFATIVGLIRDALLQHRGSGRKSFQHARQRQDLKASDPAAYGKLGRMPIPLSMAFLADSTARLLEVFPQATAATEAFPQSLEAWRPIVFDGKAIKNVARRLKPLRIAAGGLLGGRTLVALDLRSGLVLAMHGHPDGDANDVRFVGELVPTVCQRIDGPCLWIVDSGFCDLTQTAHFTARPDDQFIVRYHPKVCFQSDEQHPIRCGQDRHGRHFQEQWGWLGAARNPKRRYVRRITLEREGQKDVVLITSLCDAETVPAADILEAYLRRWSIEQTFQQVTEVFGLAALIGTTPEGTIFQFALCLLLYNMIQVVRGVIASESSRPRAEISTENLFDDVRRDLIAWAVVVDHQQTLAYFAEEPSAAMVRRRLGELLGGLWYDRWRKAPAKRKPPPHPARPRERSHSSVYRLMQTHQEKSAKTQAAVRSPQRS